MKLLAASFALLLSSNVFAAQMAPLSSALTFDDEDERYTTIASYDIRMDLGDNVYVFDFEEAVEGGNLSLWYEQTFSCRSFGVNNVNFMADMDAGEWIASTANPFDGTYHYLAPANTLSTKMTLSTDRLIGQNCRIFIRQANFEVPALIDILARVDAACGTDDDGAETCNYSLEQINSDLRANFVVREEDALRFNLMAGSIYRITGHIMLDANTGAEHLEILTSRWIMD